MPPAQLSRCWLELASGAAGDMLLGALLDAGADLDVVQSAIDVIGASAVLKAEPGTSGGVAALRVHVIVQEPDPPHRTWQEIRGLLTRLPQLWREPAERTFAILAQAEARAHGTEPAEVHFHEVGAHDAIADIVGVCAALAELGVTTVTATTVSLGGGAVTSAHGELAVPVPAVREIVARHGIPHRLGPVDAELCTPTGAALLAALVSEWSDVPPLPDSVVGVGRGAGTRELPGVPNVVTCRLAR